MKKKAISLVLLALIVGVTATVFGACMPKLRDQAALYIIEVSGKRVGDDPFTLQTTGGTGLGAITFAQISGSDVADVSSDGVVTIKAAGNFKVVATKAADFSYYAVSSSETTITIGEAVAKQNQNPLVITPVVGKMVGDVNFYLKTTGGSGSGEVTFTQTSGSDVASVNSAGLVSLKLAGEFSVVATKAGDVAYNPIESEELTISVGRAEKVDQQTLTVDPVEGKRVGAATFKLTTSGGSGSGAVTFTQTAGTSVATVSSAGDVIVLSPGYFTVTATKAGDVNYNATTSAERSIVIADKDQQATLSIVPVSGKRVGDEPFYLTTTGGSGNGEVTFEQTGGSDVATVSSDGLVIIKTVGEFKVIARKASDSDYKSAISAEQTIIVANKLAQSTLTINPVVGKSVGDASFTLTTSGGNGSGAVTFTQTSGYDVATVTAEGVVTILAAGEFKVYATKAGDSTYNPATSEGLTITIANKLAQSTLTIDPVVGKSVGDASFTLTTSGGSGSGAVTFTQTSGSDVATVTAEGVVTILAAGEFKVYATKAGDGTYNPATSEGLTITIAGSDKLNQNILSIISVTGKMVGDEPFTLTTSGGSGTGAVTFTQTGGANVATVSAEGVVTIHSGGVFRVVATKAGDSTYNPATSAEVAIIIGNWEGQIEITIPDASSFHTHKIEVNASGYYKFVATDAGKTYIFIYDEDDNNAIVVHDDRIYHYVAYLEVGKEYEMVFSTSEADGWSFNITVEQLSSMPGSSSFADAPVIEEGIYDVVVTLGDMLYRFTPNATGYYRFSSQGFGDPVGAIFIWDGTNYDTVAANDDYAASFMFNVIAWLQAGVEYHVGLGTSTGAYVAFTLEKYQPASGEIPATATTITLGQTETATITDNKDLYYKLVFATSGWYSVKIDGDKNTTAYILDSNIDEIVFYGYRYEGYFEVFAYFDASQVYYLALLYYGQQQTVTFDLSVATYQPSAGETMPTAIAMELDTPTTMTIEKGQYIIYSFTSSSGGWYAIDMSLAKNSSVYVRSMSGDIEDTYILSKQNGFIYVFRLNAGQTGYMVFSAYDETELLTTKVTAHDPLGETIKTPYEVELGTPTQVEIEENYVFYKFVAPTDGYYSVTATGIGSAWFSIEDIKGEDYDDFYFYFDNGVKVVANLKAGEYYIRFYAGTARTVDFVVDAFVPGGENMELALELTLGEDAQSTLEFYKSVYYKFTPAETGYYIFASTKGSEGWLSYFKSDLELLEAFSVKVDSGFAVAVNLTQGETYYFELYNYEPSVQTISVRLDKSLGGETIATAFEVEIDQVTTITVKEEYGLYYVLTADVTGCYAINLYTKDLGWAMVLDEDLYEIPIDNYLVGSDRTFLVELTQGETYYIRFTTSEDNEATFDFMVEKLIAPLGGDSIENAVLVGDEFDVFSSKREYQFFKYVPTESGTFEFTASSIYDGDSAITVYVYNTEFEYYQNLGYNDDSGSKSNFKLQVGLTAGTEYIIELFSTNDAYWYTVNIAKFS